MEYDEYRPPIIDPKKTEPSSNPTIRVKEVVEPNPVPKAPPPQSPRPTDRYKTPLLTPEDKKELADEGRKRMLWRTYRRVGMLAFGFLLLAGAYYWMSPHPEKRLTWQRQANGKNYDVRDLELKTPLGENGIGVTCPNDSRLRIESGSNGITEIRTFLGRDREVPLRLKFVCEQNSDYLVKSRTQLFAMIRKRLDVAGGWNVLSVAPEAFLGLDNGIPYREIQYLRSEKDLKSGKGMIEQWYGYLIFFVHGDCVFTFTREIPAVEQWRGGGLLVREKMLWFEQRIIDGHWEGRPDYRDRPIDDMLAEVDGLLALRTAIHWREVEFLLQSVLIRSGGTGKSSDEAMKRLIKLRTAQRVEFNRLKALACQEIALGVKGKGRHPSLDEALRVFSSPDDRRYTLLKKGHWE